MSEEMAPAHYPPARPPTILRVVRGEARPDELAALVAVLSARVGGVEPGRGSPPPSPWVDRARYLRRPLAHGPGAWRASALPH